MASASALASTIKVTMSPRHNLFRTGALSCCGYHDSQTSVLQQPMFLTKESLKTRRSTSRLLAEYAARAQQLAALLSELLWRPVDRVSSVAEFIFSRPVPTHLYSDAGEVLLMVVLVLASPNTLAAGWGSHRHFALLKAFNELRHGQGYAISPQSKDLFSITGSVKFPDSHNFLHGLQQVTVFEHPR